MSSSRDKGYNICFLSAPPEVNSNGVVCTRPGGHEGPHEARGEGDRLIATWSDEVAPVQTCGVSSPNGVLTCTKSWGHGGPHKMDGRAAVWDDPVEAPSLSVHQKFLLRELARRGNGETVCFMDDTFSTLEHLVGRGFVRVSDGDDTFSSARLTPEGYAAIGTTPPAKTAKKERVRPVLTDNEMKVLDVLRGFGDNQFTTFGLSEFQLADLIGLWIGGLCRIVDGRVVLTDEGRAALTGVPRG